MIGTVHYYRKTPNPAGGKDYTNSRTTDYDLDYGVAGKSVRTPFRLAFMVDSKPKEVNALLNRLEQPVWGPNKSQKFGDLFPDIIALPKAKLLVYVWKEFMGVGPVNTGWYDIRFADGSVSLHVPYWSNAHIEAWILMGVKEYKLNDTPGYPAEIDNPDYEPALQLQTQQIAECMAVLKQHLVITAKHQFPALPLNEPLKSQLMAQYGWTEEEVPAKYLNIWKEKQGGVMVEIPVSDEHELALPSNQGGWKFLRKTVRNYMDSPEWMKFIQRIIGVSGSYQKSYKLSR